MNWWRRLSIVAKLPLGIGLLLLLVLGGMTTLAYADLRRNALESASERLNRVAPGLAVGLAAQEVERAAALGRIARNPVVLRYLALRDSSLRERAHALIRGHGNGEGVVELWGADGVNVLSTAAESQPLDARRLAEASGAASPATDAATAPLLLEGGHAVLAAIAAVREGETLLGYITERQAITATPEAMEAITSMLGEESRVLIGNANGDVWTDLQGMPVPGPPADVLGAEGIVQYVRSDRARIARSMALDGTPWVLLVELWQDPVYASATRFLGRSLLLTLLLTAAGAMVAFVMSRRISLPLKRVTDAAETLAAGAEVEPVLVRRADEVGRLAASFNAMAEEVRRSHQLLEERVADRTAALQEANRELESFSYSVSHDLRAPLRAVDGFAAILVEDHQEELSSEAQRYLTRIRTSAQQMGALIDDLLAFSRLGRQPINRSPVDMEVLAHDVVEEVCRQEGRATSEVTIGTLPPAAGERSMIRQVFVNLVQNALKFTRGRAQGRIVIDAHERDGETVYFVQDNGVGFDMRYADKLFGVFQRLHGPEEFEGTGVGLAVVKRVVERHGGRIWAQSAPDAGATFNFTIPSRPTPAEVGSES